MNIYMAVTADQYELPLLVCDSSAELARKLGRGVSSIRALISRKSNGERMGYKVIVVSVDEKE